MLLSGLDSTPLKTIPSIFPLLAGGTDENHIESPAPRRHVRGDQSWRCFDRQWRRVRFLPVGEGDTLPREAINSIWFAGPVDRTQGELILTLLFPIPRNYSQAQAFPAPLENVPEGPVVFPLPLNDEEIPANRFSDAEGVEK